MLVGGGGWRGEKRGTPAVRRDMCKIPDQKVIGNVKEGIAVRE